MNKEAHCQVSVKVLRHTAGAIYRLVAVCWLDCGGVLRCRQAT